MNEIPLKRTDLTKIIESLGEEKIHSILKQFYKEMSEDLLIGFFFEGKNLEMIAEKQSQFLLRAFGARQSYEGLSPSEAHKNLAPILAGHFDRRLILLRKVLTDFKVDNGLIETWIQFEGAFRDGIQNK